MRSFPSSVFPLLLLLGLSACSGLAVQDRLEADNATEVTSDSGTAPRLPAQELTEELLYQILEAETALHRRHYDVAVSRFLQLAETTRDPRFAERAARVAAFVRDDAATLEAARLWAELEPERDETHQMMIVAAIRNGELETALAHMEILLSSTTGSPEDRFEMMAGLLSREHDLQEALRLMEQFVSTRQDNPEALFAYGNLAMRAGELDRAMTAVDRALEVRPGWHSAILLRVQILQLQNKPAEALDSLAAAVERYPDDVRLRRNYARMLTDQERYQEAIVHYEFLAEEVSPNTEILFTLAMIELQLERLDEAEQYLLQVRDAGTHEGDLQYFFGWLEEKRENPEKAISHYSRVAPGSDNYFEARVRLAVLTSNDGDIATARQHLQDLRIQYPDSEKRLYQVEAELLQLAGRTETALSVLGAAIDTYPEDFDLRYSRALLAESAGRLELSEQDLLYILERDPDHADALNALGYTLADRTDRYREAYEYISRALDLKPDNYAILDSMGWVLYRLGRYDEALQYLRRSIELKHDHEVAAHLGEVLWQTGNTEEAREVWERALEEYPDKQILHDVMQRFLE